MKKRFQTAVCLYLLLLVQTGYAYYLEGTVFGPDGSPVADALIKILTVDRREVGRSYSNERGEYRIANLPGGSFTLDAIKTSMPSFSTSISISGPTPSSTIYFDVRYDEQHFEKAVTRMTTTDFYLTPETTIRSSAMSSYRKGLKKLEKGKTDQALKYFSKACTSDPTFSRAFTQIGILLYKSSRIEESLTNLTQASILNPADPLPLIYIGRIALDLEDAHEALKQLEIAQNLDSSLPITHALKGKAFYLIGDLVKAEYEFSQALLTNPNSLEDTRLYLAEIFYQKERIFEARSHLQTFLREYPEHKDAPAASSRLDQINQSLNRPSH